MAKIMIYLLGPFYATLDGKPVIFAYDKVRALLAYLAIEVNQAHLREKLAGLLWPDQPQQMAQDSLRQALSKLRQSLNDQGTFPPLLLVSRETIQLNEDADVWVDAWAFQKALATNAQHHHRHPKTCPICANRRESANQFYKGAFLNDLSLPDSDLFENWAAIWREKMLGVIVEALNLQIEYYECLHNDGILRECINRLLDLDPLYEPAHIHLIRLLARTGKRNQALNHYQKLCITFMEELGVEPSAAIVALYEQIKQNSPELTTNNRSKQILPTLPAPTTPLVGRQAELTELGTWLTDPSRRLVSIIGPGGVGKTRLAIAAVETQGSAFVDGTIFLSLTQAGIGDSLSHQLIKVFHLNPQDSFHAEQLVIEHIKNKDILLVLDGFEHMLAGRDFLKQLLEISTGLVVLITSRERLGLQGEWILRLGGLEVPPPFLVDELEHYSAVKLFLQKGLQVSAGFTLTNENRTDIGEICRLLEGMPLALDLAAAWVSILSCKEIANEIRRSLDFLTASTNGENIDQRSIRAVFDQSWQRLSEVERQIFARLTVFRGGFSHQAAKEIAEADLFVLASLVDKSFLRGSKEGRFDLHDLLQQYGAEKLAEFGETDVIHRSHFEYYLQEAEKNEQFLFHSSDPFKAFVWLVHEQPNLHAALEWASAGNPPNDVSGSVRLAKLIHEDIHGAGVHRMQGPG